MGLRGKLGKASAAIDAVFSLKAFGLSFSALLLLTVTGISLATWLAPAIPVQPGPSFVADFPRVPEDSASDPAQGMPPQGSPPETSQTTASQTAVPSQPGASPVAELPQKPKRVVEDVIAGLTETTVYGMAPVIRKEDGLTPYNAYKADYNAPASTKSLLAFVMVDFGTSVISSANALKYLPGSMSFVASPYAADLQKWIGRGREQGGEVWLYLPIETQNYPNVDTGPFTLLSGATAQKNNERLLASLSKATGYAGVVFPDRPRFANDRAALDTIVSSLAARGLGVAQQSLLDEDVAYLARNHKLPFGQNTLWLDTDLRKDALEKAMDQAEKTSLDKGTAVVFFHPYPALLTQLPDWVARLKHKGIEVAPLSAIIDHNK